MNLGLHAGFIVAAYAVTLCVVALLIFWVIADHRLQRRSLTDLEARRSAPRKSDSKWL